MFSNNSYVMLYIIAIALFSKLYMQRSTGTRVRCSLYTKLITSSAHTYSHLLYNAVRMCLRFVLQDCSLHRITTVSYIYKS